MQLSQHFQLSELLASPTATADGFSEQFIPPLTIIDNLQALATNVLEPLRVKLNAPITISSGYRCPRLNAAVGGEPTSQHLLGEAADCTTPNMDVQDFYQFIKTAGIPFDQLIIEHDSNWDLWCHVSFNNQSAKQRGECMIGKKLDTGGTVCEADGYGTFLNQA